MMTEFLIAATLLLFVIVATGFVFGFVAFILADVLAGSELFRPARTWAEEKLMESYIEKPSEWKRSAITGLTCMECVSFHTSFLIAVLLMVLLSQVGAGATVAAFLLTWVVVYSAARFFVMDFKQ